MVKEKYFFLLFLLIIPPVFSQSANPRIEYFINDYANLLTYDEIASIEPTLKEIYDSGAAEYAIVITDSLNGTDIESYSYKLAEGNLGDTKKDNGLLLLIAVNDRRYRFEVGRGLEPVLPDIIVGRIGRYYLEPNFKNGEYAKGIQEASFAIKDILFNNTESAYFAETQEDDGSLTTGIIIFIILFIIAISIISAASRSASPAKGRNTEDYFTAAWILSSMLKGGKGGFGGGSGGFGGFGGGSFGGGGGSGGW